MFLEFSTQDETTTDVFGTATFQAPEAKDTKCYGLPADIYSLGKTMQYLLEFVLNNSHTTHNPLCQKLLRKLNFDQYYGTSSMAAAKSQTQLFYITLVINSDSTTILFNMEVSKV